MIEAHINLWTSEFQYCIKEAPSGSNVVCSHLTPLNSYQLVMMGDSNLEQIDGNEYKLTISSLADGTLLQPNTRYRIQIRDMQNNQVKFNNSPKYVTIGDLFYGLINYLFYKNN